MMDILLSLAGHLLYFRCMMGLAELVQGAMIGAFPSFKKELPECIQDPILLIITYGLRNFRWVVLTSESHYPLPSRVSQVIAILLSLVCYLVCMMIFPALLHTCVLIWSAAVGEHRDIKQLSGWLEKIAFVVTFVVTDMASYYMDPDFISEFLSGSLGFLTHALDTPLNSLAFYLVYIVYMLSPSYLLIVMTRRAIRNTRTWWPELIHTTIVGLMLLLLNMMWGSPFQKPASMDDPNMKSALVGYLIYVVCSTALNYHLFGTLLLVKTFVISLTFVLLNMFVKASTVFDIIFAIVGLSGMLARSIVALFILVALSFLVFMFLDTWADILLPSARRNYPAGVFVSIMGLTFMVMRALLGSIPVEEPSIFSDVKAGLLAITDMINEYHGTHVVIRGLSVLAIPLLSMESRRGVPIYQLYTTVAFVIAIVLVLTLPPEPGMPSSSLFLNLGYG